MSSNKISVLYNKFLASSGVSTDSRSELNNKIFFSLKGKNFDGNKFAQDALDKGAILSVIDDKGLQGKGDGLLYVDIYL